MATHNRSPWDPQTDHSNTDHSNGHPRDAHLHPNGDYSPTDPSPSISPSSSNSSFSSSTPSSPLSPSKTKDNKNPAAISLRAFALGFTLSSSLLTTLYLSPDNPHWRLPFFLLLLSLFHFLEFYTTALSNSSAATVSAFLLSSNGKAYNIAHGLAFLECFLHHHYFPTAYTDTLRLPAALHTPWLVLGAAMLLVGQATRTIAMMHAGTNFNHLIQHKKKKGHVLVTGGIYRYLRHPSYFGFFWWGMGTQVVLGNAVCLVGYAVVLRRFFRRRIEREETLLVGFFGMDYVRYRDRTSVGIPFIS